MADFIKCSDIKQGMIFKDDNYIYECIDLEFPSTYSSPSRYPMPKCVIVIAKNHKLNQTVKKRFLFIESVELVSFKEMKMEFLYDDGVISSFIDPETYDTTDVLSSCLEWEKNFLTSGAVVTTYLYENEVIKVVLPNSVQLTLIDCDKWDGSSPTKYAICETGLKIKVPVFLEVGEKIIVSTSDGTYQGRA